MQLHEQKNRLDRQKLDASRAWGSGRVWAACGVGASVLSAATWWSVHEPAAVRADWPSAVVERHASHSMGSQGEALAWSAGDAGAHLTETSRVVVVPSTESRVGDVSGDAGLSVVLQASTESIRFDAERGLVITPADGALATAVEDASLEAAAGTQAESSEVRRPDTYAPPPRRWRAGGGVLGQPRVDAAVPQSPALAEVPESVTAESVTAESVASEPAAPAVAIPQAPQTESPATPRPVALPVTLPAPLAKPAPPTTVPTEPSLPETTPVSVPSSSPSPSASPSSSSSSSPSPSVVPTRPSSDEPSSEPDKSPADSDVSGDEPVSEIPQYRDFTIWNGLAFNSLPDEVLNNPHFPLLHIVYPSHIWPSASWDLDYAPEERIREIVRSIEDGTTVCYDIEHWRLDPDKPAEFARELQQLLNVVTWTREENPTLKVGFYGILPGLRADVALLDQSHPRYQSAMRRNDALRPLAEAVDMIFPWMYTVVDAEDADHWSLYVRAKIAEARRIAPSKPVYPFLWFRYHQAYGARSWQMIEPDFWRLHIELMRESADGAVIWGGYRQNWNPTAGWWLETEPLLSQPVPVLWGD